MVNKKNADKILVIVLVSGMMTLGLVFPATVKADDLWANVPNLDLLNGTWKGSYSKDQAYIDIIDQAEKDDLPSSPQEFFGDLRQITKGEITITFDAGAKTVSISGTDTVTLSGGKINSLWDTFKSGSQIRNNSDSITFKFNDINHSLTRTFFILKSYADTNINFRINQDGTKLKVKTQSYSLGLRDDLPPPIPLLPLLRKGMEIIMTK